MCSVKVREAVREDAKRQHRSLGMYCALFCWHQNKNAVFVSKDMFLSFIGLERLKDVRFQWLKQDIAAYFPHVFIHKKETNSLTIEFIVLSRIQEEELLSNVEHAIHFNPAIFELAKLYTPKQHKLISLGMDEDDCSSEVIKKGFPFIASVENIYEFAISNTLSSLTNGLIEPELALSKNA